MILRTVNDDWWGISQTTHAWLAGQLARNWGNEYFAVPEPRVELLVAAELHDIGWTDWEQNPEINEKSGLPYNFLEMPLLKHIAIWKNGSDRVLSISRFVAWLVSCHNSYLLNFRDLDQEPDEVRIEAEAFLDEQKVLQNQLIQSLLADKWYRPLLTEASMLKYQQLLRAWDYFSLVLCMGDSEENEIPVGGADRGQPPITVKKDQKDFRYFVKPWPFNKDSLQVGCEAIKLRKQTEAELLSIKPEQFQLLEWELIPG
ncbi:MAG TPA: DUF3891 family protein [Balneolales bacterium]|nr:DUF3891 family protein [Balneolales bacterium]